MDDRVVSGIRRTIASKGFYQSTIAEKAGFTNQQFSDMLNGRKIIRAEYLPAIANALGVTPNELYGIKDTDKAG